MQTNYGYLLLLFMSATKAFPLSEGDSSKDYENSEITIKQVHLKPNQTLEVLLEIQSKASEQDKDGDQLGSVAGQILNEFYEQKKFSQLAGEQYTVTKQKPETKRPAVFAKPGSEDDEAEAPVRIQTQNLAQIGTDTEVDIYEEVRQTARPFVIAEPNPDSIKYVQNPVQTDFRNPAEEAISIVPAPVQSNAEIISNILANVNAENPRGWNKTIVYQEPYQPVSNTNFAPDSNSNFNNGQNQGSAGTFTISNGDAQGKPFSIANTVPNTNNNGQISINLDGQQNQVIPVSNIISLPPEVTEPARTTAGIPVETVPPTAASTDEDDDEDEDEDEDSASRVARTK